jgi:hypothetical protein
MRVRRPLNRLCASLSIAALLVSGPARADILDIAIEVVKPELAPAKPLLKCMIGGTAAATCVKQAAVQQGNEQIDQTKQDIQNDPDFQEVMEVYQYANTQQWAKLIAKVGVTAACAAFAIPGSNILCDEFSGELVSAGAFVGNQSAGVVNDVGKTVGKLIESGLVTLSCAIGFGCPQEADPTKYTVDLGAGNGKFTIDKWDLAEVWKIDYAARVGEGIKARISDHRHLARMIASDPPTRFLNVVYSYDDDALGSVSVHKREKQMRDEGAGDVNQTGLFPRAFMPYGKEFNARWIVMVNKATADSLEGTANTFNQYSHIYLTAVLSGLSFAHFEETNPVTKFWAFPKLQPWQKNAINTCRAKVEDPARALPMWAAGAAQAQDDGSNGPASLVAGQGAPHWAEVTDWCRNVFASALFKDMAKRRKAFDAALKMGCAQKQKGTKGLDCIVKESSKVSLVSGGLKQCYIAYSSQGKKYCKGIVPRGPAVVEPDPVIVLVKPKLPQPIDDADIPLQNGSVLGKKKVPRKAVPLEPDLQQIEQSNQPETPILVPLKPVQTRPALAAAKSTLCHFTSGPRADQTQDYAPMAPIPVGSSCQDARGSFGIVVAQ